MLKSMTGYGRANIIIDSRDITVEIKSVNHRYLDLSSRISRAYLFLDEKLRSHISKQISRGKVEVYVTIYNMSDDAVSITLDIPLTKAYLSAFSEIERECNVDNDIKMSTLTRFSDIFHTKKADDNTEEVWIALKTVIDAALKNFTEMKLIEGEKLAQDIKENLDIVSSLTDSIEEISPQSEINYREKLYAKMKEVLENNLIDEQRILTEAAIFADKAAVFEEISRLKSHISQFNGLLKSTQPVGKKMDYLIQEFGRETNTIGSKANNIEITKMVLEMKSNIEKIREQIQNIE